MSKQNAIIALLLAVTGIAGVAIYLQLTASAEPPAFSTQVWYYDLNTGQLFAGEEDQYPPIAAPSDEAGERSGVRAFVKSCGDCDDPDQRFIGYLMAYQDPDAAAAAEQTGDYVEPLMRRPDDEQWYPESSDAAMALNRELQERCDTPQALRDCRPD